MRRPRQRHLSQIRNNAATIRLYLPTPDSFGFVRRSQIPANSRGTSLLLRKRSEANTDRERVCAHPLGRTRVLGSRRAAAQMSITTVGRGEALRAGRVWDWPDIAERKSESEGAGVGVQTQVDATNGTYGRPKGKGEKENGRIVCVRRHMGKKGLVLVVLAKSTCCTRSGGGDGPGVLRPGTPKDCSLERYHTNWLLICVVTFMPRSTNLGIQPELLQVKIAKG
ncbi:hypothetical protein F5144DRAFT_210073 [Chaetomium tenue]|uniref:Uncharacterized protein n=1 Tax=Chaetomium tenue TaxID=1854479 RepID=A0ACB7PDW1_9PEZI|nr:hypothetical protein F5144DRAFT_210073 [Chaetomium globosum]